MRDPESRDPEQPPIGGPALDPWLAEMLPELLPARPLPEVGRGRLLQVARSFPFRYAPFYDQLGALWDLSEPALRAVFEAAADAKAWQRVWPGFRFLGVGGGPKLEGARARLLHFDAGLRFPRHRHRGAESILVLEGSYTDSSAITVSAGDLQEMRAGSDHDLVIAPDGPCVAGLVERGLEFTSPVLKLLGRWFSL